MLFSNRPIAVDSPGIMDIGPTVLDLFGVAVPPYCDGQSLMPAEADADTEDATKTRSGSARAAAL